MKNILNIDKLCGRVTDASGSVVFDPDTGPGALRPNSVQALFEATTEGDVKISISYVEVNGGFLTVFADHPQFGTSWADWSEQKERARMAWLAEFLKSCGTPVGKYSWGRVQTLYDSKGGQGLASIKYDAQQAASCDRSKTRSA